MAARAATAVSEAEDGVPSRWEPSITVIEDGFPEMPEILIRGV
jgi:hypothetical protein